MPQCHQHALTKTFFKERHCCVISSLSVGLRARSIPVK
jgi:hypothetical protein